MFGTRELCTNLADMVPKEDCSGVRTATHNETLDSGIMKVKTEICGEQLDENGEERALFAPLDNSRTTNNIRVCSITLSSNQEKISETETTREEVDTDSADTQKEDATEKGIFDPASALTDKKNQRSELIEANEDHDVISDSAKVNVITVSTRGSSAPNPFRKLHETGQPPTKEEMDNYLHIHPAIQELPDVQ